MNGVGSADFSVRLRRVSAAGAGSTPPELSYPLHDRDAPVTACGRICIYRKRVNVPSVLAGQRLGMKEVDDGIRLVGFMSDDLVFIDREQKTLHPLDDPFGPRL